MQLTDTGGVSHFAQGLGFDLADALAGHLELPTDLLQRARIAVIQAETQFQDSLLALGQASEHVAQFVFQQAEAGLLRRALRRSCPQ